MRTVHQLTQGSDAWKAHRATILNASEAPAVMGASKFTSRSELLKQKATGIVPEVSAARQALFDKGHAVEAPTIALIEEEIGDELAPVVATIEIDGLVLGASYDGLTLFEEDAAEVKLWNEDLAAQIRSGVIDMHYVWQLEQQFIVTPTLKRIIFATSDGTRERFVWMEYRPVPGRREQLIAAWKQFSSDLAAHVPPEVIEKATAAPIEALPAISARIMGELTISSNLPAFGEALKAFVARIPAKPSSEQEFADAEAACKALKKAEEALDGAEANALGQVQSVEVLTRTIGDLRTVARTARLATEKLVKARKEQIRIEECQRGKRALDAHVQGLNEQIGAAYMPAIVADFGAAISGVKTIDSLRARVDQLIADKKIEANEVAGRITVNLRTMKAHGDYEFLFADLKQIVTKAPEDFQALVQSRVLAHQAEEKRRAEAAAEKERERIRAEEQAKAEKEAREKLQREQEAAAQRPSAQPAVAPPAANDAPAAAKVVPMAQAASRGKPTLRLGQIQERIAPLSITASGLEALGFKATKDGAASLYHEADFAAMLDSMVASLRTAQHKQLEAA